MIDFVDSFSSYISRIEGYPRLSSSPRSIKRFLFRGQADKSWSLIPTLARINSPDLDEGGCQELPCLFEKNLVSQAKRELPTIFHDGLQPLDLLARLQHFGVPTRLLDVSENPLTALYFACSGELDRDGEVLVFADRSDDLTDYPIRHAVAESYLFAKGSFTQLFAFYDDVIARPYFASQRHLCNERTAKEKAQWIKECCDGPMLVMASKTIDRQAAQAANYILFPNIVCGDGETACFGNSIRAISKEVKSGSGLLFDRIIIPLQCKQKMVESLRLMGVTRGSLFPDNVEAVCADILERCKLLN